jgi:Ras-related protein Rab-1A
MVSTNSIADRIYKLLLIGESNVGKTSIILRYTDNQFKTSGISTLGVDVKCKYVSLNNTKIKLDIWDTAGQERFRGLAKNYFRGANGFILVYDITDKKSFDRLKGWINDAKEKACSDYKMIVVGNKKDCQEDRVISFDTLAEFGKKNNVLFFEVSAKTGEGIEKIFNSMVEELLKDKNIGLVKDDESEMDKTFNSLDNSRVSEHRHNCNC